MISTPRPSLAAALATAALLPLGFASCGSDAKTDSSSKTSSSSTAVAGKAYPTAVEQQFTKSCVASAKASDTKNLSDDIINKYCSGTLKCIEGKLSLDRFKKVDAAASGGATTPDSKVATDCAAQVGKSLS